MGNLYIVATPIGNLQDITLRAIQTLFSVDYIFSEQPNKTSLLISKIMEHYPQLIGAVNNHKMVSLNEFEEINKIPQIISLLEEGHDVALVSEAGTPLISDPGFKIVKEAWKRNITVIPIPGASSIITALSASPLPTDKFLFIGFLPKSAGKRGNHLTKLKKSLTSLNDNDFLPTVVFFESPHRILESLESLETVFGNIEIIIARELTKIHEEFIKGTIQEMLIHDSIKNPKGEFVVLFNLK